MTYTLLCVDDDSQKLNTITALLRREGYDVITAPVGAEALKLFEKGREPQILKPGEKDGYVGELLHMLECIRSGNPPGIVTAQDGVSAIEICEAEERSVKSGQIVPLE